VTRAAIVVDAGTRCLFQMESACSPAVSHLTWCLQMKHTLLSRTRNRSGSTIRSRFRFRNGTSQERKLTIIQSYVCNSRARVYGSLYQPHNDMTIRLAEGGNYCSGVPGVLTLTLPFTCKSGNNNGNRILSIP
jgi:hypothetical protein